MLCGSRGHQDASGGLPPAVVQQVVNQGRADGRAELGVEHGHSEWSTLSPLKSQVVGKFGDVRALPSAHNLGRNVEHRQDGLSQLTAGLDRPPHLRVDVVKGAEGGTKRGGVVLWVQHLHCAPQISRGTRARVPRVAR